MFSHFLLRRLHVPLSLSLGNCKLLSRRLLVGALCRRTFPSPTRAPSNIRSCPYHWGRASIHWTLSLLASCSWVTPTELRNKDFRKKPRHLFLCGLYLSIGAGIAQSQRQARRPKNQGCSHNRGKKCSCLHSVQSDPEAHPASYPMSTGGFSLGVMWGRHDANHSPASTSDVKNGGAIPPLPNIFLA
jgi:hypothetical protein